TVHSAEHGGEADFNFHSTIVRASKSDTLTQLYSAMATLLLRSHRDRRQPIGRSDETVQRAVVEDHRRLLEAIIAGNEDRADQALRKHFRIGDEFRRQQAIERPTAPARKDKSKETTP
ncbi:MAG TPA: FCD domain-containing protein, partial [Ramlibacter sp.]|nr:FCD domain-containing protein [Ramlibacter sp.]